MRKRLHLRLAPIAILLVAGVASAQTETPAATPGAQAGVVAPKNGSITGVVTDASSGKPVAGAVVIATSPAMKGEQTVVTDASGKFIIANLPAGDYRLAVQLGGYKLFEWADLVVKADTTLRASLTVIPEAVQMEEVVVTGSRLKRKELQSDAPVVVISREQIQESGKTTLGDFLQSIPQQGNAINTQFNNSGDGSTRINLRGLGSARTLVLVNGRRFVPGGTGADASVDLNAIPTNAIERIEVLLDGASAIYGSDAVAGVVNVITRRHMDGGDFVALGGASQHGDGGVYDLNATMGTTSEKGSLLFSMGYYNADPVFAGDRDFSKNAYIFDYTGTAFGQGIGGIQQGSSAIPQGRFSLPVGPGGTPLEPTNPAYMSCYAIYQKTGSRNMMPVPDPGGDPTKATCQHYTSANTYNYQPVNYLVTPLQRITAFSSGDLKLGDYARAFYQFSFVNRYSQQQLAPEPLFTINGIPPYSVSAANQYNPYGVDISDFRRRLTEFGPRQSTQYIDTYNYVLGLDGTLPSAFGPLQGWSWDASFNYGYNNAATTYAGALNTSYVANAVGPSKGGVCYTDATFTTPIPGCVPLDLFHPGAITPAQIAGLSYVGTWKGFNQLTAANANLAGEIVKLWAEKPMSIAVGYEFLNQEGGVIPDPVAVQFLSTDYNSLPTYGMYWANAGYAELNIPVISDVPFVDLLEVTGAIRYTNYNTFGGTTNWKVGARYRPIRDVTLRGTYGTAFRAPNIAELYSGVIISNPQVTDPCAHPANQAIDRECQAQGVPAGGNGDDRTQLVSHLGGNANLKPETADIFTGGIVYEPRFVKELMLAVDYWWYNVKNSISDTGIGEGVIMASCYPTDPTVTPPKYCELVHRDPKTGLVSYIDNLDANVGSDETAGIDILLRYSLPTSVGRFSLVFNGTWLQYFNRKLATGQVIYAKGTYDLGVYPAFKFNANITYALAGWGAGLNIQFVGSFKECSNGLAGGNISGADGLCYVNSPDNPVMARNVPPYAKFDIFGGYSFSSSYGKTSITVGINNLFNTSPAVIYDGFLAASDAATYDYMGRYFWLRLAQSI